MRFLKSIIVGAASLLLMAGTASAQFVHAGNPDVTSLADMTSGGSPTVLEIEGLSDISSYAFDGSDLEIPFTLSGSGAKVWLVIYHADANPPLTITGEGPAPYNDPEHPDPGWHVYEGVNPLVFKSNGERFEEGDNAIVWNGHDNDGNVVPAGSYKLFLAAFDDEAAPHLVAGAVFRKLGTPGRFIIDTANNRIFDHTRNNNMNNDWIENFEGFDLIDHTAITDAGGGTPLSGVPLNSDMTEFIGIGQSNRLMRWTVDWDSNRLAPEEDWGIDNGAEEGIINIEELPGSPGQRTLITNPDKTVAYVTAGVTGTVAQIVSYDVETGAKLDTWDVTDLFIYDNAGSDRVGGPMETAAFYNGEPPPEGITTTSHHTSCIVRHSYDGDLMWMNRNGDGFGDTRAFNSDDGTFGDLLYGHTEAPNFKYSIFANKWGWVSVCENGLDNTSFGAMLGEDGSGLFKFEPKQAPLTWSQHVAVVDEGDDWDGVYMIVGGFGDALASNEWVPEDVGVVPPTHPVAQFPYDQKQVTLGSADTAIAEVEGAATPNTPALGDAYPNPFNPETTIRFDLPWQAPIQIKVYNQTGQLVRVLANQVMGPGKFTVTWDGRDDSGAEVSTGVYLYRIEAPNLQLSKKVTFLK